MITVSCFSRHRGRDGVAISTSVPRGWSGRRYPALAPSWSLVNDYKASRIDEAEYARRYYSEVLSKLDPLKVAADLGADAVLLCWERSGFCHRMLVLDWLRKGAPNCVCKRSRYPSWIPNERDTSEDDSISLRPRGKWPGGFNGPVEVD